MAKDRKRPEGFSGAGRARQARPAEGLYWLCRRGRQDLPDVGGSPCPKSGHVVLAFIETHDRLDTAALIEGLQVIPLNGSSTRA